MALFDSDMSLASSGMKGNGSTDSIPSRVLSHFDGAVQAGHIHVYNSSSTKGITAPANFPHLLHVCPDLASKPAVPPK